MKMGEVDEFGRELGRRRRYESTDSSNNIDFRERDRHHHGDGERTDRSDGSRGRNSNRRGRDYSNHANTYYRPHNAHPPPSQRRPPRDNRRGMSFRDRNSRGGHFNNSNINHNNHYSNAHQPQHGPGPMRQDPPPPLQQQRQPTMNGDSFGAQILRLRSYMPYLQKRKAQIFAHNKQKQFADQLEEIESYMDICRDVNADNTLGEVGMRGILSSLSELVRLHPIEDAFANNFPVVTLSDSEDNSDIEELEEEIPPTSTNEGRDSENGEAEGYNNGNLEYSSRFSDDEPIEMEVEENSEVNSQSNYTDNSQHSSSSFPYSRRQSKTISDNSPPHQSVFMQGPPLHRTISSSSIDQQHSSSSSCNGHNTPNSFSEFSANQQQQQTLDPRFGSNSHFNVPNQIPVDHWPYFPPSQLQSFNNGPIHSSPSNQPQQYNNIPLHTSRSTQPQLFNNGPMHPSGPTSNWNNNYIHPQGARPPPASVPVPPSALNGPVPSQPMNAAAAALSVTPGFENLTNGVNLTPDQISLLAKNIYNLSALQQQQPNYSAAAPLPERHPAPTAASPPRDRQPAPTERPRPPPIDASNSKEEERIMQRIKRSAAQCFNRNRGRGPRRPAPDNNFFLERERVRGGSSFMRRKSTAAEDSTADTRKSEKTSGAGSDKSKPPEPQPANDKGSSQQEQPVSVLASNQIIATPRKGSKLPPPKNANAPHSVNDNKKSSKNISGDEKAQEEASKLARFKEMQRKKQDTVQFFKDNDKRPKKAVPTPLQRIKENAFKHNMVWPTRSSSINNLVSEPEKVQKPNTSRVKDLGNVTKETSSKLTTNSKSPGPVSDKDSSQQKQPVLALNSIIAAPRNGSKLPPPKNAAQADEAELLDEPKEPWEREQEQQSAEVNKKATAGRKGRPSTADTGSKKTSGASSDKSKSPEPVHDKNSSHKKQPVLVPDQSIATPWKGIKPPAKNAAQADQKVTEEPKEPWERDQEQQSAEVAKKAPARRKARPAKNKKKKAVKRKAPKSVTGKSTRAGRPKKTQLERSPTPPPRIVECSSIDELNIKKRAELKKRLEAEAEVQQIDTLQIEQRLFPNDKVIIGRRDIIVNAALGKIKMEVDYNYGVVKNEPMDEDETSPFPFDFENQFQQQQEEEDDIEVEEEEEILEEIGDEENSSFMV